PKQSGPVGVTATPGCCPRKIISSGTERYSKTIVATCYGRDGKNRIPARKPGPGWRGNQVQAWPGGHFAPQLARKSRPYQTHPLARKPRPYLDKPLGWRVGGVFFEGKNGRTGGLDGDTRRGGRRSTRLLMKVREMGGSGAC